MAPQSQAPVILLTRPIAQSQRFARSLRTAFGAPLHITIAPLMQVEYLPHTLPFAPAAGLIFTSEAGLAAYSSLPDPPKAPVWCVGQRTAEMAIKAGLEPVLVAKNAADLLSAIIAARPDGPFLHLRGQDSFGNIAATLTQAGIPTTEAVIYAQRARPLAPHAIRLLATHHPIIVPLFSARSAALFCAAVQNHPALHIAALSLAVAAAVPSGFAQRIVIAAAPDANAMLGAVISLLTNPKAA